MLTKKANIKGSYFVLFHYIIFLNDVIKDRTTFWLPEEN